MDLHPNAATVLAGFEAFARGDMAALKELYSEDAIWHNGGRSRFGGDYHGPDAIIRHFGELTAEASIENTPHAILADDEHVVVLSGAKLTRGRQTLELNNVFVFHVAGGKVTETWITSMDQYAADEFWG
ncbi:MAG: nuclear transport factor 2 family protein [Acidimicrobiia bacterium]